MPMHACLHDCILCVIFHTAATICARISPWCVDHIYHCMQEEVKETQRKVQELKAELQRNCDEMEATKVMYYATVHVCIRAAVCPL